MPGTSDISEVVARRAVAESVAGSAAWVMHGPVGSSCGSDQQSQPMEGEAKAEVSAAWGERLYGENPGVRLTTTQQGGGDQHDQGKHRFGSEETHRGFFLGRCRGGGKQIRGFLTISVGQRRSRCNPFFRFFRDCRSGRAIQG